MRHPENYKSSQPIPLWAEDDKPREKLSVKGKSALSNSELLAIIIGSGNKTESALDLAKRIMDSCSQNLVELSKLNLNSLCRFKGIGNVKAINIIAALELGRRRQQAEAKEKPLVSGSITAYELVKSHLQDLQHEEFWVMYLNRANAILSIEKLSSGGITGTVADSRIILTRSLELKATGMILVHNHPSGSLKPSSQDIDLTKKMKTAAATLDIAVLDHLIISDKGYYSFADEGMI